MKAGDRILDHTPSHRRIRCIARYGRLLAIVLGNLLLTVITLGLYAPWGRVRVRRYLWSETTIDGEPLDYTGTGGELLRGAIIVLLLVFLPLVLAQALVDEWLLARRGIGQTAGGLLLAFLAVVGTYRAMRYRLRRTLWSGLGATMTEGGWRYAAITFLHGLHVALTLGLTLPAFDSSRARAWYPTMWLAGAPLRLDDGFRPLWRRWLLCWLLLVPTLGVSIAWYRAAFWRRLADHLQWAGQRFRCDARGGGILWLVVGNLLIGLLSLGLLAPLAALRSWRFWCRHVELEGSLDLVALKAVAGDRERSGEGLASMLDVDAV